MITKTFAMQSTTGFAIEFTDQTITRLQVTARAECYVRPLLNGATIAAPGSSPAPSGGQATDYIHLTAGDSVDIDLSAGFVPNNAKSLASSNDEITRLVGWGVAAGDLLLVGV